MKMIEVLKEDMNKSHKEFEEKTKEKMVEINKSLRENQEKTNKQTGKENCPT